MSDKKNSGSLANWKDKFKVDIRSAQDAVKEVRPGWRVFIGTGCGAPSDLIEALTERQCDLADVEILQFLPVGKVPYARPEMAEHFRVNSFFVTDGVRETIDAGKGDYTPISMFDIPRLFRSGEIPLDVVLIQVSPPDERGICSLGVSVDIVKSAAENAGMVIAEVNPNMPRTGGDSSINIYDLDILVPVDHPLIETEQRKPIPEAGIIGEYLAALVEDGSTLELGIGVLPHVTLEAFKGKADIGIHTEAISDSIIDLIDSGVVNGRRKSLDRGKVVTSFCMGTKKLYDYIDGRSDITFRSTEYVNSPLTISRQNKMVAINTAAEIDLTGQVCGDSIGTGYYSGMGGQLDFNRGAHCSENGKSIIVMPSTARDGKVSRIVGYLSPGSGVVANRGSIHYVVTEYGTAYLRGKSIQGRALALISIAHPDFRAELIRKAIEAKYLLPSMAEVQGKMFVEPPGLRTTMLLKEGTQVKFRPIHPTDEPRMRDLFYALSEGTIYYRFGEHLKKLPQKQIQDFVYIDHRTDVTIVGTFPSASGEEIVALGSYYLDAKSNRAEIALVTHDKWQNRGIGTFMMHHMAGIARRNGIRGFSAVIHATNTPMRQVMHKCPGTVKDALNDNVYTITVDF